MALLDNPQTTDTARNERPRHNLAERNVHKIVGRFIQRPKDGTLMVIDDSFDPVMQAVNHGSLTPKGRDRRGQVVVVTQDRSAGSVVETVGDGAGWLRPKQPHIDMMLSLNSLSRAIYSAVGAGYSEENDRSLAYRSIFSDIKGAITPEMVATMTDSSGYRENGYDNESQQIRANLYRELTGIMGNNEELYSYMEVIGHEKDIEMHEVVASGDYPTDIGAFDFDIGAMPLDLEELIAHHNGLTLNPYQYIWTAQESSKDGIDELQDSLGFDDDELPIYGKKAQPPQKVISFIRGE